MSDPTTPTLTQPASQPASQPPSQPPSQPVSQPVSQRSGAPVAQPSTEAAAASGDWVVEGLEVTAYTLPTDQLEADGTYAWDSTTLVLVEARSGGHTGVGWSYAPTACAELIATELRPLVLHRPVADVSTSWQAMVDAVRNIGRPGVAGAAISAVDLALWDLRARTLDLPLHQLLGAVRDEVALYGSGGFTTYDASRLDRQLDEWLEAGMRGVKIKIGEDRGRAVARDLARTAQVGHRVGGDVDVMVDANGGYRTKQALTVSTALEELGVTWFEEPVTSDDLPGLRTIAERTRCEVTAGEYGYDLAYFARMCSAGAVDCLQVDVTRCGGITEWRRVAGVAAGHHLDVSAHCAPNATLAVAAATANFRHAEWFHDHVRIESKLFDGAARACDGAAPLPTGPGNGLTFRHPDAERFRVR